MNDFTKKEILRLISEKCELESKLERKLDFAKRLDDLEHFVGLGNSSEATLYSYILKIEKALKTASSFDEFKAFCLEGCDKQKNEQKKG